MTHRIRLTNLPLTSPRLRTLRPKNFLNINRLQRYILLSMMRVQGSIRPNLIILIPPLSHQLNHLPSPRLRVLKPQHRHLHILELPQKLRVRPKGQPHLHKANFNWINSFVKTRSQALRRVQPHVIRRPFHQVFECLDLSFLEVLNIAVL